MTAPADGHLDRPVRRGAGRLRPTDRPVGLPHLDPGDATPRFLGRPLDAEVFHPDDRALWSGCTGGPALHSWPADAQSVLQRWYASGLVVAARDIAGTPPLSHPPTVVSPHPDDASLALGGLLAAGGGRVVNVFTRETWTRQPYYRTRPSLTSALLLAEERVVGRVLGTEIELLDHVDAADRAAWGAGFLVPDLPAEAVVSAEPDLLAGIVADLDARLAGAPLVLAPLGVGGHVDHVVCREAVLELVRRGRLGWDRLGFYEDMPYAVYASAEERAQTLGADRGVPPLRPLIVPTPVDCVAAKREALWVYRLQVAQGIATRVLRYGDRIRAPSGHGERLWLPTPTVQ